MAPRMAPGGAMPPAMQQASAAVTSEAEALLRPLAAPAAGGAHQAAAGGRPQQPGPAALRRLISRIRVFLHQHLETALPASAARDSAEVLSRPAFRSALLLTLSVSARRPCSWGTAPRSAGAAPAAEQEWRELLLAACDLAWGMLQLIAMPEKLPAPALPASPLRPVPPRPAPAVIDFVRRLLRAQTLQCLAARMAAARAAAAAAAPEVGRASGGARGRGAALVRLCKDVASPAAQLLTSASHLLRACLSLEEGAAAAAAGASTGPPRAASSSADADRLASERCYAQDLAAALSGSRVAEHCAATMTVLLQFWGRMLKESQADTPQGPVWYAFSDDDAMEVQRSARAVQAAMESYGILQTALTMLAAANTPGASFLLPRRLPSALGPCVLHKALAHGLAILACLDGGPAHGMPAELAEPFVQEALAAESSVPLLLDGFRVVEVPGGDRIISISSTAALAITSLCGLLPKAASTVSTPTASAAAGTGAAAAAAPTRPGRPLLSRRAAMELSLRLARLMMAPRRTASATEKVELTRVAGGRCAVVAYTNWVDSTTMDALGTGPHLYGSPGEGRAAAGGKLGEEWWRLVVRVAAHLRRADHAAALGGLLLPQMPLRPPPPARLPPAPSPALAAALAGGVLPCLERLIRRAASNPDSTAATALLCFMQRRPSGWSWLAGLLAYGDVRQAAALVRSVAKALPRADLVGGAGEGALDRLMMEAAGLLQDGRAWLDSVAMATLAAQGASGRQGDGGAGGGAGMCRAERQLAAMLGAAAQAWFPEHMRQGMSGKTVLASSLLTALAWVPLLSTAPEDEASRADAAAAGSSSGGGGSAGGGGGTSGTSSGANGWRRFAYEQLEAIGSLELALMMQGDDSPLLVESKGRQLTWTAEGCAAVAAAWPEMTSGGQHGRPFWKLQEVRSLAASLRARGRDVEAEAMDTVVGQLVSLATGRAARTPEVLARLVAESFPHLEAAAALLPASPAAARQVLGGCSNPDCANLEGDSDAGLQLMRCGGCGGAPGAVAYCSRKCQAAHWKAGHKDACGGRSAGSGTRGGG
ncbi:hypothetical protein HYH03_015520 [Edaphochlamys debaryana]|uniref:phytol kinase n=1 Tax=Edaphochlamys debaryana TaxID=47281 RepID=A0A835XRV1_9CHLO|nr:hypothetical protein HYH03_015520 [Edaphochlamys debaryana]|eukprot:KAG2485810.1 hypothetical protein HYH03_015520 [Edaphochlamys debaryana]